MATYTTNLGLKKPAQSDKIRIADINNNMDDIDAAFGAIGDKSVATQVSDIRAGMAIVAVSNTHAAIASGEYVYVTGHDTLDDGLYTASSAIAANGTLSSSNLTAVSKGGLNALNDQIVTEYTDTASFATGITGTKRITKKNGVVTLNLSNIQGLTAHGSQILTLSTGFRPSSQITVPAFIKDTGAWASADTYVGVLNIETTGVIEYNGKTSNINGKVLYAGCSYTV